MIADRIERLCGHIERYRFTRSTMRTVIPAITEAVFLGVEGVRLQVFLPFPHTPSRRSPLVQLVVTAGDGERVEVSFAMIEDPQGEEVWLTRVDRGEP